MTNVFQSQPRSLQAVAVSASGFSQNRWTVCSPPPRSAPGSIQPYPVSEESGRAPANEHPRRME